jgi:ATP-dependent Clp protease adaptor protein ClpS
MIRQLPDSQIQVDILLEQWGSGTAVAEADTERQIDTDLDQLTDEALEPMYRVLIHNDEVTPMEFVVIILQRIFGLTPTEAEHVMFTAHYSGLAYVASLPLEEANKRVSRAHFAAQLEGYPLTFTIEPE